MKILLDNGHGKETPGKRSPIWPDGSQLFEWEFNRDIVRRIYTELKSMKIESIIIVPEEIDIPLDNRVRRINKYGKDCFLISVHANAGGGTGWECYTSKGKTKSDQYAQVLCEEAKKMFPEWKMRFDYTDGDADKEEDFYIIKKTICPAVLTENFFMDTEKDCRFIISEIGRESIAKVHINAIIKILEKFK